MGERRIISTDQENLVLGKSCQRLKIQINSIFICPESIITDVLAMESSWQK